MTFEEFWLKSLKEKYQMCVCVLYIYIYMDPPRSAKLEGKGYP